MGKTLYVGNLPFSVGDQQLQDKFSQFGSVNSAKVITDRETGRSKGFGFVEMANDSDADTAISQLNGTDFEGRKMNVSEKRADSGGGARRGFGGPRGGGNRRPGSGGFRGGNGGGGHRRSFDDDNG